MARLLLGAVSCVDSRPLPKATLNEGVVLLYTLAVCVGKKEDMF